MPSFYWEPDSLSDEPPVEGLSIPITSTLYYGFKKAISQMKMSKAQGPSGIVVEMIQAADDNGASKICDLAAAINCNGKVLSYWEQFHCLLLQG